MMNELINITTNDEEGTQVVSARELHEFLQATERFSAWFDRYVQYDFEENIDYVGCKVFNTLARQELQDYAITIDMAKELSMLQRTKKGKQARKYFINVEKNYKNELLRIQDNAYRKIGQLQMELQVLQEKIPKPVLIAKREINIIELFNYINEISGDGLLFNGMYYIIDNIKGTLSIDIRRTYKILRTKYRDIEMFKSQPIAIEKALEKHNFCYGTHFIVNLLNDKFQMEPTYVAIIDIKRLKEAGGCIDNLQ